MEYPGFNAVGLGPSHRVHINPNFRGRIVHPTVSGGGERPFGIHVNPHWKPKSDVRIASNECNIAPVITARLPDPSHFGHNQRRTIHINPKVIASMGPESLSELVKQENVCNESISVPSASYTVNTKLPPTCYVFDKTVATEEVSVCEPNILNVKPTKMDDKENKSSVHMFKYRKSLLNISSPVVKVARTVMSKYKYLNNSVTSHPSMHFQYTLKKVSNGKQMNAVSSRFKYIKKPSNEIPTAETSGKLENSVISRYKLVKKAASEGGGIKTALTSNIASSRSKAGKILETVKNIHIQRMKSQYRGSKPMTTASGLLSTYHANVPKRKSNSRFKFVRQSVKQSPIAHRTLLKKKSPRSVTSRFKIVRKTTAQNSETPRTSRYRVVRNGTSLPAYRQRTPVQYPIRSAFRHRWLNSRGDLQAMRVTITNKKLLRIGHRPTNRQCSTNVRKKAKLLNIGGVFYRSTRTTLTRSGGADSTENKVSKAPLNVKGQILSIRGSKFILDKTGKTLRRFSPNEKGSPDISRIHIGGVTFVRSSEDTLVRSRVHEARNLVSQAKHKSIAVLTSQLRKNNQPCLIYQRLGKCSLHEKGICRRVHDPKTIAVCQDFVKGKCLKSADECSLSHNIGPEKMPTCHFFLQGCCVRDPCPYLHVKLNKKAAVCRDFLSGYCDAGDECKKRHVFLCPEFEEMKSCSKGKYCKYRHAGTPKTKGACANKSKDDIHTERPRNEESPHPTTQSEEKADPLVRYYIREDGKSKNRLSGQDETKSMRVCLPSIKDDVDNDEKDTIKIVRPGRSKLGDLPAYIPL